MSGRLTLSLMAVIAAMGAVPIRAQGPTSGQVTSAQNWQAAPSHVDQANFGYHPYADPYCPPGGGSYFGPPAPVYEELVPTHSQHDYYSDPIFQMAVSDTLADVWCEIEYLNYDIKSPGNTLLGAPLENVPNPREPFLVSLPNDFIGFARVTDVSSVTLDNLSGIKGRFGIPFEQFSIEVGAWGLEQNSTIHRATDIPPTAPQNFQSIIDFVATSLLTDGEPGDRVILYDGAFEFLYRTDMWAGDANIYYNFRNPTTGWRILPLTGFRFEQYEELLRQRGTLDNSSGAFGVDFLGNPIIIDPVTNEIKSVVENARYEIQTGFRTEWVDEHFTVGVEPKIGLGISQIDAQVRTEDLRDTPTDLSIPPVLPAIDDPVTFDNSHLDRFAATVDVGVYAKWHVSRWLDLKVGYNFMWMGNVGRADRMIYYNDLGVMNPVAVEVENDLTDIWVQGISVGGTISLP